MNALSEQNTGYACEESKEMGEKYAKIIQYDEEEVMKIINDIYDFFKRHDETKIFAQFQRFCLRH